MSERQRAEAAAGGQVFQAGRDVIVHHVPAGTSRVWNLPPRNPHFTGREETLTAIRGALTGGVVAVQSLHGLGGVGKSQTAIEYAHRHAADYRCVWWIPAERPELVPEHLARLEAALGGTDFRTALSARSDWLLIFDNAESPRDLHPLLPSGGHVLITTRNTGFGGLGAVVRLDVLPRADSVALLRARVSAMSEEEADDLAELLGDLPLGLAQAAAYLEESGLPLADYFTLIRTHERMMFVEGEVVGYPHTIGTVWSLSLRHLADRAPRSLAVLRGTAFLAPEAIPIDLVTGSAEPIESARLVAPLVRHGLVQRDGDRLSVHRLLQAHLRHEAGHDDLLAVLARLRDALVADGDGVAGWRVARQSVPHLVTLMDHRGDGDQRVEDALAAIGDALDRLMAESVMGRVSRALADGATALGQPSAEHGGRLDPVVFQQIKSVVLDGVTLGVLLLFVVAVRGHEGDPDRSPSVRLGTSLILGLVEVGVGLGGVEQARLEQMRAAFGRTGPRRAPSEETRAPR
ncbi:hypothetical protein ABZ816_10270 [Actinosynnema sp. NPDC047251]|uniref:NB-ARC domain-containing protein n=1 Tax=Saccharothrix espanaensis (strain ATCC 51144 / DSM 44229 / JCM 9112 / NBRC 15066 / NRRL 15764) TaxID=1179773 RepID=K0K9J2_SACES|nr:hypothetical protein [Saccharothrix espanaensis]CCH34197.1 hypothetical protein BN6_69610 [Saccharothrix espanaensis DSM 44229]